VRGNDDGRCVGLRLELARRHGVHGLVVRVPLRRHWLHLLHMLGVGVRMAIVLRVGVGRIGVVEHRRVRCGGHVVVVLVLLSAALVHGPGRRHLVAGHAGAGVASSRSPASRPTANV
jgi:hypothetical protein